MIMESFSHLPVMFMFRMLLCMTSSMSSFLTKNSKVSYSHLLEIEKYLKAILAYYFCLEHPGQYDFLDINCYKHSNAQQRLQAIETISRISKVINKNKKNPNAISHYIAKHDGVPLWVVIQFMQLGDAIELYDCSDDIVQSNVAREFSKFLKENTGNPMAFYQPKQLYQLLQELRDIRNIVAHNNRLFDHRGSHSVPYISDLHDTLGITASASKSDLYNTYIAMACLLSKDEYVNMQKSLVECFQGLKKDVKCIDCNTILNSLGFPSDWQEVNANSKSST